MAKKKYTITFHEAQSPIMEAVTKFGGQPTWITEPQWPISRATSEPMRFICQIALDTELFGEPAGRVAYLFMSEGNTFVDNTYDLEGGENAVIIQPGGITDVATQPLVSGPTFADDLVVELQAGEDPDSFDDESLGRLDENKIGGTPAFMQNEEYPAGGFWRFLLQLDSCSVPFYINFGDAGVGYAFLSEDGKTGKFLWQCA